MTSDDPSYYCLACHGPATKEEVLLGPHAAHHCLPLPASLPALPRLLLAAARELSTTAAELHLKPYCQAQGQAREQAARLLQRRAQKVAQLRQLEAELAEVDRDLGHVVAEHKTLSACNFLFYKTRYFDVECAKVERGVDFVAAALSASPAPHEPRQRAEAELAAARALLRERQHHLREEAAAQEQLWRETLPADLTLPSVNALYGAAAPLADDRGDQRTADGTPEPAARPDPYTELKQQLLQRQRGDGAAAASRAAHASEPVDAAAEAAEERRRRRWEQHRQRQAALDQLMDSCLAEVGAGRRGDGPPRPRAEDTYMRTSPIESDGQASREGSGGSHTSSGAHVFLQAVDTLLQA
ncbi:hypothetical protein STCU_12216 [Strigomonas culicis]|uniref:Uncharacterized protein n=1 Tax=Strigomonas culicis TaxID=28005 RepID=S9TB64_9TRYP|nr:hypothetical protein STCU_12216 [Strigomonas culicis]|eukprot:EPY15237.1 hypothetical protein STCU_12216 [Strigomonas culicis]